MKPAQIKNILHNEKSFKERNLSESKGGEMTKNKFRPTFGDLDLIAAALVVVGVYLVTKNYSLGWIVAVLGVLKQFSGK